jgi:hypothetical protein
METQHLGDALRSKSSENQAAVRAHLEQLLHGGGQPGHSGWADLALALGSVVNQVAKSYSSVGRAFLEELLLDGLSGAGSASESLDAGWVARYVDDRRNGVPVPFAEFVRRRLEWALLSQLRVHARHQRLLVQDSGSVPGTAPVLVEEQWNRDLDLSRVTRVMLSIASKRHDKAIFEGLMAGNSMHEISDALGISVTTVCRRFQTMCEQTRKRLRI